MGSYQEPTPGWSDGNFNGPTLVFLGAGLGFVHVTIDTSNSIDLIPVDMCTNALLSTTWDAVINQ